MLLVLLLVLLLVVRKQYSSRCLQCLVGVSSVVCQHNGLQELPWLDGCKATSCCGHHSLLPLLIQPLLDLPAHLQIGFHPEVCELNICTIETQANTVAEGG
jgi:hypothetical protein